MTITPKQFIAYVRKGRDISIQKPATSQRVVTVRDRIFGVTTHHKMSADQYSELMEHVLTRLAIENGRSLTIDTKISYLGGEWIEIRSGLLGRKTSRVALSPRFLTILSKRIAEFDNRSAADPALSYAS